MKCYQMQRDKIKGFWDRGESWEWADNRRLSPDRQRLLFISIETKCVGFQPRGGIILQRTGWRYKLFALFVQIFSSIWCRHTCSKYKLFCLKAFYRKSNYHMLTSGLSTELQFSADDVFRDAFSSFLCETENQTETTSCCSRIFHSCCCSWRITWVTQFAQAIRRRRQSAPDASETEA